MWIIRITKEVKTMATDYKVILVIFLVGASFLGYGIYNWGVARSYLFAIAGCGIIIADFALAFLKS
jgi:hypothetical protein